MEKVSSLSTVSCLAVINFRLTLSALVRSRCALTKAPGQPGNLNVTKSNPCCDVRHCSRAIPLLVRPTRYSRLAYRALKGSSDGPTGVDGGPLGELLPPSCPMWPDGRDRLQAQTYVNCFPYKHPHRGAARHDLPLTCR